MTERTVNDWMRIMSPRKKEDFEKIREERKADIREVAYTLFAESGYQKTSIAAIAKAASVSKGLMYNYYDSKDALLLDVVTMAFHRVEEYFPYLKEPGDQPAAKVMERYIRDSITMLCNETGFWRKAYALTLQKEVAPIIKPLIDQYTAIYLPTLLGWFTELGYKNPLAMTGVFSAHFDGLAITVIAAPDYILGKEEELAQILIELYIPRKSRKK